MEPLPGQYFLFMQSYLLLGIVALEGQEDEASQCKAGKSSSCMGGRPFSHASRVRHQQG